MGKTMISKIRKHLHICSNILKMKIVNGVKNER